MKPWLKILILTVVITIPAFLAGPNAPLGGFWGADPHGPQPAEAQVPLFMLLGLLDALFLGLGVSFLVFGYPLVATLGAASKGLSRATYLSMAGCWCSGGRTTTSTSAPARIYRPSWRLITFFTSRS